MLAKFVFPKLGYPGWVGLSEKELTEKCEPFKYEVREHWKRLKRSSESMESTLKPYVKTKWCDTAYFLAQVGSWCVRSADGLVRAQSHLFAGVAWQDHCMQDKIESRLAVSQLAVMAFVRITCARAGSAAKDWHAPRLRT